MQVRLECLALVVVCGCGGHVDVAPDEDAPPTQRETPAPAQHRPTERSDLGKTIALSDRGRPQGLALDETFVYWADAASGTVLKVAKKGGAALPIATNQASPSGVAVSEDAICWTNTGDGTVRKAPLAGGPSVTLASAQASPRSVTIAHDNVYFTTEGWPMRVPLGGGDPVALKATNGAEIPLGQGGVQGITSDGTLIYAAPYQLLWPIAGSCEQTSMLGLCSADWYAGPVMRAGAVDGTSVFTAWGNIGGGAISGSDASGSLWWLASDPTTPEAVAVDETHVYWVSTGTSERGFTDGAVMKVPRSGGRPTAIAVDQIHPVAIAVDASFVFWTNEGNDDVSGAVLRAPK